VTVRASNYASDIDDSAATSHSSSWTCQVEDKTLRWVMAMACFRFSLHNTDKGLTQLLLEHFFEALS
jgi:hypothetical protein